MEDLLNIKNYDEVTVNVESLWERLHTSNLVVNPECRDHDRFSTNVTSSYKFVTKLVSTKGDNEVKEEDLLEYMEKQGFRPAEYFELLAFRRDNQNRPERVMRIISDRYVLNPGYKSPSINRGPEGVCVLSFHYYFRIIRPGEEIPFVKVI